MPLNCAHLNLEHYDFVGVARAASSFILRDRVRALLERTYLMSSMINDNQ